MEIDPARLSAQEAYRLMISAIVPRPIAWVSTVSPRGVANAAPFSYFQALSSRPPMVMIAIGRKRGGEWKDTKRNIDATGEFVVNVVSAPSALRMVATSKELDYEVSEFEAVGLGAVPSVRVKPPRIEECGVALECRLDRVLEIGSSAVCVGEVLLFHVRDDLLLPDGTIHPLLLQPLGRLGGDFYADVHEISEIPRDAGAATRVPERVDAQLLSLWTELRTSSAAMARALKPEHLPRTLGAGGDTVGRIFRHLAGATAWLRLHLAGREEEETIRLWDPSFTPERLAAELEADREEFVGAILGHLPEERRKLRRMIRHEAWHQGQIAAAMRDAFPPEALWKV